MRVAVFDFDGTLVDSDVALLAPFHALGVIEIPPLGLPLVEACERAGVSVDDYVARYDPTAAQPFTGVVEMIARLPRWAVCSNKQRWAGELELAAQGWAPEVALFTEDFGLGEKQLGPILGALDLRADQVVYVGDTGHDRACAARVGAAFALAGWNPRAAAEPGDIVLATPADLLPLLSQN